MPQELVVLTPENAEIRVPLAGMFSRAAAFAHDLFVMIAGFTVLQLVILVLTYNFRYSRISVHGVDLLAGLDFLITLAWFSGYFSYYEIIHNGQTPGKKAHGIRVIGSNGQKVRLFSSLLRNFLRIADFFPFLFMTGLLTTLITDRQQRIGDLFASTVVIREEEQVSG